MDLQHILHFDRYIADYIAHYGVWFYAVMFCVIFAETGFVVTPFLPGDTLLFAAGIFCNNGKGLDLTTVLITLTLAPILGDTLNYHLGKTIGHRVFNKPKSRIFNPKHLADTHEFFDKYGSKTVMLARWVPIVRTLAPFVAGMSKMPFSIFIRWSALGAFIWVWVCTLAGFFFGRIPWVAKNFEVAMLGMILVTVSPIILEVVKGRRRGRSPQAASAMEVAED